MQVVPTPLLGMQTGGMSDGCSGELRVDVGDGCFQKSKGILLKSNEFSLNGWCFALQWEPTGGHAVHPPSDLLVRH